MRTLYLYILDTLADWEPGILMAELCSGRYLRDERTTYTLVTCGRTLAAIRTMGGLKIIPDVLVSSTSLIHLTKNAIQHRYTFRI